MVHFDDDRDLTKNPLSVGWKMAELIKMLQKQQLQAWL